MNEEWSVQKDTMFDWITKHQWLRVKVLRRDNQEDVFTFLTPAGTQVTLTFKINRLDYIYPMEVDDGK